MATPHTGRRKGFVFIYTAMTALIVLPLVGLAIDGGRLFIVKAKLQSAVDGAVLGASRCLSRSKSLGSQTLEAEAAARDFFNANFPSTFWGSTDLELDVKMYPPANNRVRIGAAAQVNVPLWFGRILGYEKTQVFGAGEASRRWVNVILVLDRSGSIKNAGADDDVIINSKAFINKFFDGTDDVGIVSYSGNYFVDFPHSLSFKPPANPNALTAIDNVNFDTNGNTNTATGLWQGYQQLVAIGNSGAFNAIVLFTDGLPTALSGSFHVRQAPDLPGGTTAATGMYAWDNATATAGSNAGNGTPRTTSTLPWPIAKLGPLPLHAYPLSTCTDKTDKVGFIAGNTGSYNVTFSTYGVHEDDATSNTFSETTLIPQSAGCKFNTNRYGMRQDIAFIPDQDRWGNYTIGLGGVAAKAYKNMAPNTFPAGHPYEGHIRADSQKSVRDAAFNAADDCARRIREDSTLNPVIFTIGLGGTSSEDVDDDFLRRLANDPASSNPVYDNTRAPGLYVRADTVADLEAAFNRVASEILRLAK